LSGRLLALYAVHRTESEGGPDLREPFPVGSGLQTAPVLRGNSTIRSDWAREHHDDLHRRSWIAVARGIQSPVHGI